MAPSNHDTDDKLRRHVLELLRGAQAHAGLDRALARFPVALRGKRPAGFVHTAWQLVEHIRLAQADILEFTRDSKHQSPPWPEGYWPTRATPPSSKAWGQACAAITRDLLAMQAIVLDPSTRLLAPLPHDPGKTVLREALLLADHNAYHVGQLIQLRRALGAWKE